MSARPQARPVAATPGGIALARETARRYDLCHPVDSFDELTRRAAFSKEDRRLREDWLAAVGRDLEENHA